MDSKEPIEPTITRALNLSCNNKVQGGFAIRNFVIHGLQFMFFKTLKMPAFCDKSFIFRGEPAKKIATFSIEIRK